MLPQHDVGLAEPIEQAIVDHGPGALSELLSRLEDQDQRALPCVGVLGESSGGSQQAGDVHIVAAGVHNRHIVAVAIGSTRCAGIRQSGLFFHRQSVHIGTQQRVAPPPFCNTPTTPVPPTPFSTW